MRAIGWLAPVIFTSIFGLAGCAGGSGDTATDADGDGYPAGEWDCDDGDPAVHSQAAELCDGIDNDCDGLIDDDGYPADAGVWYPDADGDGFISDSDFEIACDAPDGYSAAGDTLPDCDDDDPSVNPAAEETCDGIDTNCSGDESDAPDQTVWYLDEDGDGYGQDDQTTTACVEPSDYAPEGCDCDDTDRTYKPGGLYCEPTCGADGEVYFVSDCGVDEISETLAYGPAAIREPGLLYFCPGRYAVELSLEDEVILRGAGADEVTLTPIGSDPILRLLAGPIAIEHVSLTGGDPEEEDVGAAIHGDAEDLSVSLSGVAVHGNTSDWAVGGAVMIDGSVSVVDSAFYENEVAFKAGYSANCKAAALYVDGSLYASNSSFYDNSLRCQGDGNTRGAGGGIHVTGNAQIVDSEIRDNTADAICSGNAVYQTGAGAYVGSLLQLERTVVTGNYAEAALMCDSENCIRDVRGGGIWVGNGIQLVDSEISGNSVAASGPDDHENSTEERSVFGGGIYSDQSFLECVGVPGAGHGIHDNAAESGGGVYWDSPTSGQTFTSADCDWGSGATDNEGGDLRGVLEEDWDGEVTFECTAGGGCP